MVLHREVSTNRLTGHELVFQGLSGARLLAAYEVDCLKGDHLLIAATCPLLWVPGCLGPDPSLAKWKSTEAD